MITVCGAMKKCFKALLTIPVIMYLLFVPVYFVGAAEAVFSALTETEIEFGEWEIMSDDEVIYSNFMPELEYAYSEDVFSFYDQLDDNNKAAYNGMKNWLDFDTGDITVTFPDALSFNAASTDINSWDTKEYNEFWNLIFSSLLYGEKALSFDYPELFWVDLSNIKVQIGKMSYSRNFFTRNYNIKVQSIKLTGYVKEEYGDIETAKKYSQLLENSVNDFEVKGSNRYQKLKYIHDYIANAVTYDMSAPFHDTAVGLFCEPYAIVCEGYSKAFKLICDKEGIPCIVVPGNIDIEKKTGHMWNYVIMEDGEWYGIDCTWDDTNSADSPVKHSYFLKGSDSFGGNHVTEAGMTYPELCADNYVYGTVNPVTTATTTAAAVKTTVKTTTIVTPEQHIKGDYNMDGIVTVADVTLLKQFLVGKISDSKVISSDDMNGDGIINIFDCILLMQKILKGA